ncbi:MAG TPA: PQQ-dependent sugar dehydrogenase [Candidatus Binatia bacterium]
MKKLLSVIIACLCGRGVVIAAPAVKDASLQVTRVVSGLSAPTTMAFIGPGDMLVLQKNDGKVRRVTGGMLQNNPVLDVNVDNLSERGLLGIALHPNFPTSPFVYLYLTESNNSGADTAGSAVANRVYRYTWNGSALTSPSLVLDLPVTPGPNHDGGIITFGRDNKLYVVIGDLSRNGQLQNDSAGAAPDDTSVVLRINADGSTPSDNPFFAQGGNVARYYAYGIRNSFGMAFDPVTDKLWMTENGPNDFDEINLVEPGFNSGWNQITGPASNTNNLFVLSGSHYSDPKFSWLNTVAPTGIVFLNSAQLGGQYQLDAFVGDINNGNLYRFKPNVARNGFVFAGSGLADLVADNSSELDEVIFGTGFNGITDIKVGPDGLLYVVSFGDGAIYAIEPVTPLSIQVAALPGGEAGVAYNADLGVTGGTPPYTGEIISGPLPSGLALVAEAITGVPTSARNSRITLRITDHAGATITKRFAISISKAVSISTGALSVGTAGKKYSAGLKASGGKKPYTWSLAGGALPSGLVFDPANSRVTGVPLAAGSSDLTFQVSDPLGGTAQKILKLTVR